MNRIPFPILFLAWFAFGGCAIFRASVCLAEREQDPFRYVEPERFAESVLSDLASAFPVQRRALPKEPHLLGYLGGATAFSSPLAPERRLLKEWMVDRKDRSLYPHELLIKATSLRNGDVFEGLKLAWDVLRERQNSAHARNFQPHIMKLFDITGEGDSFQGNRARRGDELLQLHRGDVFSAWYHYFGVLLLAYYQALRYPRLGPAFTRVALFSSNLFEKLYDRHIDPHKRRALERSAMLAGEALARAVREDRGKLSPTRVRGVAPPYVVPRPDLFPDWELGKDQRPEHFGTAHVGDPSAPRLMEQVANLRARLESEDLPPELDAVFAALETHPQWSDEHSLHLFTATLEAMGERPGEARKEYLYQWLLKRGERAPLELLWAMAPYAGSPEARRLAAKALAVGRDPELQEIAFRLLSHQPWTPELALYLLTGLESHRAAVRLEAAHTILTARGEVPPYFRGKAEAEMKLRGEWQRYKADATRRHHQSLPFKTIGYWIKASAKCAGWLGRLAR